MRMLKLPKVDKGDSRAVSPVIGVILMVAITVILAAVIGTFVMGIGQDASQSAPQASLSIDITVGDNTTTITHDGGDALVDENTKLLLTNESSGETLTFAAGSSTDTWSVGTDVVINANGTKTKSVATTTGGDVFNGRDASSRYEIVSGTQYTVKIIDTKSQRTIFESTTTA